jgi:ribonuclease BN (tRNA processing enzyme)
MQITLLGTGTPILDPARQQSALLVDLNDGRLLFDAGRGVTSQMARVGIQPQQVGSVFITHHHYDHISNLGEFLLTAWHNGRETPLNIYGPHGTAEIVATLLRQVYARDIAFALFNVADAVDIRDLVQVTEITSGWSQNSGKWKVFAEYVDHGNSLGLSHEEWPCFGYRLEAEGKAIAISGDTVACEGLDRLAQDADVLIQCCYLAEDEITTPASERQARYVIASSGQVGKIATRAKVKKLVLTHIRPKSEAMMRSLIEDVRKDYSGELVVGEDLAVIDV